MEIVILLFSVAALCGVYFAYTSYKDYKEEQEEFERRNTPLKK